MRAPLLNVRCASQGTDEVENNDQSRLTYGKKFFPNE